MKNSKIPLQLLFLCLMALLLSAILARTQKKNLSTENMKTVFGEPVWTYKAPQSIRATPTIGRRYVYLRLEDRIVALYKETGKLAWEVASPAANTLAVVEEDQRVFVSESPNLISSYSIDGKFLWSKGPSDISGTNEGHGTAEVISIVAGDGLVYAVRPFWNIAAYNNQTGDVVWTSPVPARIWPNLYYDNGTKLLLYPAGNVLYALDGKTGILAWSYKFDSLINRTSGRDGLLFINSPAGADFNQVIVYAFELQSRRVVWKSNPLETNHTRCMALDADRLYIQGEGIAALSLFEGQVLFDSPSNDVSITYSCPAFHGDEIYTIVESPVWLQYSKSLYGLTTAGDIAGVIQFPGPNYWQSSAISEIVPISPISDNTYLIVPYGDYDVYTFR